MKLLSRARIVLLFVKKTAYGTSNSSNSKYESCVYSLSSGTSEMFWFSPGKGCGGRFDSAESEYCRALRRDGWEMGWEKDGQISYLSSLLRVPNSLSSLNGVTNTVITPKTITNAAKK